MAIQVRRGLKKDFDPSKMLPGEWGVSIDPDTNAQMVWMCFAAGVVKRMGTYEDFKRQIAEATGEIKEEYLAEFQAILDEIDKLSQQTSENTDTVVTIRDDFLNTYLPRIEECVKTSESLRDDTAGYASSASTRAEEALASASAAALSEENAAISAQNASESAESASLSEQSASASATSASTSAESASNSAQTASTAASNATNQATRAEQFASNAESSAATATEQATASSASAEQAGIYSDLSKSYAVGTDGVVREGDATDNSKYYYEQAKHISQGMNGLTPMGTVAFEDLPTSDIVKNAMYNISNEFTSDERFVDGGGKPYGAGSNVYYTADEKWDVLAASAVTGVKGAKETSYRQGNVNITCDDLGALPTDGDSKDNTVSFASSDSTEPTGWTDVDLLSSGEKHSSIFKKVSTMFKNVRYLCKMLGSADISGIGDGTATGALSAINSIFGIEAYEYDSAKSYGAKSVVVHNGKFYKSSLTIGASHAPVTGDFDASYWTEISALEFINNLRLAQNVFTDFIVNYSGQEIIGSGYNDVNTALKSVYNKTADLETSVSTLNTNLDSNHSMKSYYVNGNVDSTSASGSGLITLDKDFTDATTIWIVFYNTEYSSSTRRCVSIPVNLINSAILIPNYIDSSHCGYFRPVSYGGGKIAWQSTPDVIVESIYGI